MDSSTSSQKGCPIPRRTLGAPFPFGRGVAEPGGRRVSLPRHTLERGSNTIFGGKEANVLGASYSLLGRRLL